MPAILLNLVLPFALQVIRFYLQNRDSSRDAQILSVVKDSVNYLASQDTSTVNFGHAANIGSTVSFLDQKGV